MNFIFFPRLLLFLLFSISAQGQGKEYLDYIITKDNDTVFGAIRLKFFKAVLIEKNKHPEKDGVLLYEHSLKGIRGYRRNGQITMIKKSDDAIYADSAFQIFKDATALSPDYIINSGGDTIYGSITTPLFSKNRICRTAEGKKIKIKFPDITAFREKNFCYEYNLKEKQHYLDKDHDYMAILCQGNDIKLYGYVFEGFLYYYLKKSGSIYMVNIPTIRGLFDDDKELISMIDQGIYDYDNMYLITKYYLRQKK